MIGCLLLYKRINTNTIMAQKIMAQKIETTTCYTEQQMDYLNKMHAVCERAKELKEACVGYVIAGYDEAGEGYCYCGEGNGYKGAPLRPSCIFAVVFDDKAMREMLAKVRNKYNK